MKLISFERHGTGGSGAVVDAEVVDLTARFSGVRDIDGLLRADALDDARAYLDTDQFRRR